MKTLLASLVAIIVTAGSAHAGPDPIDTMIGVFVFVEAQPLVLVTVDAFAPSKELGTAEMVVGGATAALNTVLALNPLPKSPGLPALMYGLAVMDVVTAIRGYGVRRHAERSVVIAPTVLRDRNAALPALALGGSF